MNGIEHATSLLDDGADECSCGFQGIKQRLLQYASTTLLFGQQKVDPHLVAFNRTVLLHGPPGSGKTSLSKALAQKLAIRFGSRLHLQLVADKSSHTPLEVNKLEPAQGSYPRPA